MFSRMFGFAGKEGKTETKDGDQAKDGGYEERKVGSLSEQNLNGLNRNNNASPMGYQHRGSFDEVASTITGTTFASASELDRATRLRTMMEWFDEHTPDIIQEHKENYVQILYDSHLVSMARISKRLMKNPNLLLELDFVEDDADDIIAALHKLGLMSGHSPHASLKTGGSGNGGLDDDVRPYSASLPLGGMGYTDDGINDYSRPTSLDTGLGQVGNRSLSGNRLLDAQAVKMFAPSVSIGDVDPYLPVPGDAYVHMVDIAKDYNNNWNETLIGLCISIHCNFVKFTTDMWLHGRVVSYSKRTKMHTVMFPTSKTFELRLSDYQLRLELNAATVKHVLRSNDEKPYKMLRSVFYAPLASISSHNVPLVRMDMRIEEIDTQLAAYTTQLQKLEQGVTVLTQRKAGAGNDGSNAGDGGNTRSNTDAEGENVRSQELSAGGDGNAASSQDDTQKISAHSPSPTTIRAPSPSPPSALKQTNSPGGGEGDSNKKKGARVVFEDPKETANPYNPAGLLSDYNKDYSDSTYNDSDNGNEDSNNSNSKPVAVVKSDRHDMPNHEDDAVDVAPYLNHLTEEEKTRRRVSTHAAWEHMTPSQVRASLSGARQGGAIIEDLEEDEVEQLAADAEAYLQTRDSEENQGDNDEHNEGDTAAGSRGPPPPPSGISPRKSIAMGGAPPPPPGGTRASIVGAPGPPTGLSPKVRASLAANPNIPPPRPPPGGRKSVIA